MFVKTTEVRLTKPMLRLCELVSGKLRVPKGFLSGLMLFFAAFSVTAQPQFTLVSGMAKTNLGGGHWSVQGWGDYDVSYYPLVEAFTNFDAKLSSGQIAALDVPLTATMPPGTYQLWVALATQKTNLMVGASIGDTTVADTEYSGNQWRKLGTFTSGVAFDKVQVRTKKLLPVGQSQYVWFAGIGVLPTDYSLLDPGALRWIENVSITPRVTSDVSTGNLVPNSSFEFGVGAYGWTSGRNGTVGNEPWLNNMTTNDAFDGIRSASIGNGNGRSRFALYSPAIRIRGDNQERQYTLSFYYKRGGGTISSFTFDWGMIYGGSSGSGSKVLTLSSSWQRFQTNLWLSPFPNRLFGFDWSQASGNTADSLLIDGVQFEEGPIATRYAPADPIECNLSMNRNGNLLNTGEPRTVTVQLYNSTPTASDVTFYYEAFDWMNRLIATGTNNYPAPPGYSTQSLTLATTNNGITRMFGWLASGGSFRSELVFSVVPLPVNPKLEANSLFGLHGPSTRGMIDSNLLWGISWQRGLSPAGIVQWSDLEPTQDNFTWQLTDAKVASQANAIILANLSDTVDFPPWAMSDGTLATLRLDRWSNYVYQVVSHYKGSIHYWEDINEPYSHWTPAQYAPILNATAHAVKAADSSAFFVAMGGGAEGTVGGWIQQVWDLLSPETKSLTDAISIHAYPREGDDSNVDFGAALQATTGKPIWNTETGAWGWGDYKGDRTGGMEGTIGYAQHIDEFQYRRTVWQNPALTARNWIRSFGRGIKKYFYYDGRVATYNWRTENTNPTWYNYDDALNGVGTAYLWSKYFLDLPQSISTPTNAIKDCLAFVFDRQSSSTLAVFSRSLSNYTAQVNNGNFAVYDLMGNLLQTNSTTVPIGRIPTFWVTTTLTSQQLSSIFVQASITPRLDVTAPAVSIDLTPHGGVQKKQLPVRLRWTAIDDIHVNTDDTPNDVLTRYRLSGVTDWSDWSSQRYFDLSTVPGTTTHLELQAKDADGNATDTISGPAFRLLSHLAPPQNLRVVSPP